MKDMDNIHIVSAVLVIAKIVCLPSDKRNEIFADSDNKEIIGFFEQTDSSLRRWFQQKQQ